MGTLDVEGTLTQSCESTLDTGDTGGGDSVIRISEQINESVEFPQAEGITESISESVTVIVT
jgi:hypothetical protein